MTRPEPVFDVVVVGASLAGCTTATLFARQGLNVALVERHAPASAFKQLCTHYIQACALPVLRQLGLDRLIEAAGGVRNALEIHTPHGWIGHHLRDEQGAPLHGYNIRRATLDPIVRELASTTPGVTLFAGHTAAGLLEDAQHHINGVQLTAGGQTVMLRGRLLVAADGRQSALADMAGICASSSPNRRFGIMAPMRRVDLQRGAISQMWLTGPEVAYVFPNDGDLTVLAWMGMKKDLDAFRSDPVHALKERLRTLPDAPQLHQAVLAGRVLTVKDFPNLWRTPVWRGMALVGDAAMSVDYLWGTGCGWAFQSSRWLCDALAPALQQGSDLLGPLQRYARHHQHALAGHGAVIRDFSRRGRLSVIERLVFAAGARDIAMAERLSRFGARLDSAQAFLTPATLGRALWINLRHPFAAPNGTRG